MVQGGERGGQAVIMAVGRLIVVDGSITKAVMLGHIVTSVLEGGEDGGEGGEVEA